MDVGEVELMDVKELNFLAVVVEINIIILHKKIQTQPQNKLKSVIGDVQERPQYKSETVCFRYGSKGHWARIFRTLPHLCQLYKASLKGKEKETNFNKYHTPVNDTTHLDVSDFTDDFTDNRN